MWMNILSRLLTRLIKQGALVLTYANGRTERFGDTSSIPINVQLHSSSLPRKLLQNPELTVGEAYMNGTLTVGEDDLYGFLALLITNQNQQPNLLHFNALQHFRRAARWLTQRNSALRSQKNVAHHYNLSSDLYELFLDEDRQYSCAYFQDPSDSLETAQLAKKMHLANKLQLAPGQRVLDIGSGWGGLGLHLARNHFVDVTGVTLSTEQQQFAAARACNDGLTDSVHFELQDYRHIKGKFDRIISVGMFEHVGTPHYHIFFSTLRDRLADDGVAVIHTIGRMDGPGTTNPWIAKYIFPGGYSPALSEVMTVVEKLGLYVTDVEILRLHYAETLKAWLDRFETNLDRVREIYDEQFCRMWRFYLVVSELAFRINGHVVFQLQITKQQDVVPLTRNYLYPQNDWVEPLCANG